MLENKELIDISLLCKTISGVYILYKNEQIVYIGRAKNMIVRIIQHRIMKARGKFDFNGVKIIPCEGFEMKKLESDLIRHYNPSYNINKNIIALY